MTTQLQASAINFDADLGDSREVFMNDQTALSHVFHRVLLPAACAATLALITCVARAETVVTFDEIAPRAADGAVIDGVQFSSSSGMQIGTPPEAFAGIDGAALYGNGGAQLAFAPSNRVAFDLAVRVAPGGSFFGIATFLAGGSGGFTLGQLGLNVVLDSSGQGLLRVDAPFNNGGPLVGAVQFGFSAPGGSVALDNLTIGSQVPEPASVALMAAGLMALAWRWRSQAKTAAIVRL